MKGRKSERGRGERERKAKKGDLVLIEKDKKENEMLIGKERGQVSAEYSFWSRVLFCCQKREEGKEKKS